MKLKINESFPRISLIEIEAKSQKSGYSIWQIQYFLGISIEITKKVFKNNSPSSGTPPSFIHSFNHSLIHSVREPPDSRSISIFVTSFHSGDTYFISQAALAHTKYHPFD